MYDVVFKSAEKEFRMFVLKKAPQGMIHLKKIWKPYLDSTIYFQTWIWNSVLEFFIFHTHHTTIQNEDLKR